MNTESMKIKMVSNNTGFIILEFDQFARNTTLFTKVGTFTGCTKSLEDEKLREFHSFSELIGKIVRKEQN